MAATDLSGHLQLPSSILGLIHRGIPPAIPIPVTYNRSTACPHLRLTHAGPLWLDFGPSSAAGQIVLR